MPPQSAHKSTQGFIFGGHAAWLCSYLISLVSVEPARGRSGHPDHVIRSDEADQSELSSLEWDTEGGLKQEADGEGGSQTTDT